MRVASAVLRVFTFGAAFTAAWMMFAQAPARQGAAQSGKGQVQVNDATLRTGSKTGEDWLSYSVNWSEQRFSPLNQINAQNVAQLKTAWTYDLPVQGANLHPEGTPLVVNGVLYSITSWSVVYAVDARTGKELWHNDPDVNRQVWQSRICCGVVNRGIAIYEGKVIAPSIDGRLRALDMKDGHLLWDTRVSSATQPITLTMAPRVIKGGKVIIGVAGGEYGIRGFFAAFDVNTGKLAWKRYTAPGDPSKPFEHPDLKEAAKTWTNDWWKLGGGATVWNGFAYDPDEDLVYVGTGQPAPWTSYWRGQGDALYSSSILAVKGATGELKWYYQTTPGDDWDYDSIADLMLMDLRINGQNRKVIMQAPKNGFFYVIDRITGKLISADPITKVTWSPGPDPVTGKMRVNPGARYGKDAIIAVNPGPSGGHVWPSWTYSPATGLVYFPGTAGQSTNYKASDEYDPKTTEIGETGRGEFNMGGGVTGGQLDQGKGKGAPKGKQSDNIHEAEEAAAPEPPKPAPLPAIGPQNETITGNILYAWNPLTRKEAWRAAAGGAGPFSGGALATAGNLVFSSVDSTLKAYNAQTGELLAEFNLGVSQMGPPISVTLDGKQYIYVAAAPPRGPGAGRGGDKGGDKGAPAPAAQPQKLFALTLP